MILILERKRGKTKNSKPVTIHENINKIKKNCRRWNNLFGKIVCTTWRFTLVERIGPYFSLPNIPSPNGIIQERHNHAVAMLHVTEFTCGPPAIEEFSPQPNLNEYKRNNQPQLPFVNEERNLIGSAYHQLELNFLFSGKS